VEASAIPATAGGLARTRIAIGGPLLRIRSDEQLVSLFRAGNEDAFRVIHDRYRQRMLAYARQMLSGSPVDPEDAVQEVFVRAYGGLRASNRELALRAWLYRIAHNRCIDELRRPQPIVSDALESLSRASSPDPAASVESRDALRRLIADVQRLPAQQRSALLMRELGGVTYQEMSHVLGVSVPAVKSLLVRARVGLAQASEARDTSCAEIRENLILSHDRGVRASGLARRHLRDCPSCRAFRTEVRGVSRQLAALVPAVGPAAVIAKLLGLGGAGSGGAATAGSGASAATGATAASGATAAGGTAALATSAGHVATIIAAAVVTAGGAIELQHIAPVAGHRTQHAARIAGPAHRAPASSAAQGAHVVAPATATVTGVTPPATPAAAAAGVAAAAASGPTTGVAAAGTVHQLQRTHATLPLSETVDPDQQPLTPAPATVALPPGTLPATSTTGTSAPVTTTPSSTTTTAGPSTIAAGGTGPATASTSTPGATASGASTPATSATTTTPASSTPASSTPATGSAPTTAATKTSATASTTSTASGTTRSTASPTVTPVRKPHVASGRGRHRTVVTLTMTGS
jgi:RNA polymerase sigma factor (sigma-70 family)